MKRNTKTKVRGNNYWISIQKEGSDSGVQQVIFIPDTATVNGTPDLNNGHIYAAILGQLQKGFDAAASC